MNSLHFTDKQIMSLTGSPAAGGGGGGGGDLLDMMSSQQERRYRSNVKDDIIPSYDFQSTQGVGSSDGGYRHSRGSLADSNLGSSNNLRFSGLLEPHELTTVGHEKDRNAYDVATVTEIDHTVKKHADNLLHALEGISSRLLQLESRTRHLESSVDELKVSIGNDSGSTDGKLRQLENIMREVQTGTQVLRDKQDIQEAQLQLAKLQVSKGDRQPNSNTGQLDSQQPGLQQPVQQPPQPQITTPQPQPQPPPHSSLPAPNHSPPPVPQQLSPTQFPAYLPQSQVPSVPSLPREANFPMQGQPTDASHEQYQMPALQMHPPAQHYQPSSPQVPQFSQQVQPTQPVNPPPFQHQLPHQPEESSPYMALPQSLVPRICRPSQPPPPQQYYGSNPSSYEPSTNRPGSGQVSFSAAYAPPAGPSSFSEPYPYGGSPSHYNSSMKRSPFSSSAPSGESNYLHLPTAQILPQALPTGPSSGGSTSGNRLPVDDVVDKVATMGFSKEQVRATVRRMTENGQSVDLNVVLDKLMNDGELQPQKGWFGR